MTLDELERKAKAAVDPMNDAEQVITGEVNGFDQYERVADVRLMDFLRHASGKVSGRESGAPVILALIERVRELERDRHAVAHELGCADDACAYAAQTAMQRVRAAEATLRAIRDEGLSRDDARDEARKALNINA